jgi:hypothetical protein
VSRRYERGAIILTSNQSLGAWGEVFGDPVIASAILDRVLHHSITVNIRGDSHSTVRLRRQCVIPGHQIAAPVRHSSVRQMVQRSPDGCAKHFRGVVAGGKRG